MATVRNEARLQFLQNASEALQITAPTTSAHLGAVRNRVVEEKSGRDSSVPVCAHCGTRLIRGWSCTIFKDAKTKRTRKDRLAQRASTTKTITLKCSMCGALSSQEMSRGVRTGRVAKTKSTTSPATLSNDVLVQPPATPTEAESKNDVTKAPQKRVRGKKSTLQSLIDNQKLGPSTHAKGFGLGLQDFMK